jgi:hypothetical protein
VATGTITVTCQATVASGTARVGCVGTDLGNPLGGYDGGVINTNAPSTSWVVNSNLNTPNTDVIEACSGVPISLTISASTVAGAFVIPANGSVSAANESAACEFVVETGGYSYTSGTQLFTASTSDPYVISIFGFVLP